ncbi:transcriptional regulator, LacI family [Faunimonas pinastri]|uniref:Transcriptional regulator, LacI family n=1 Tax=Faunimonas pinastri TaxID=1855383 RepID=A0A1H9EKK7_9HYPH|nr:LacI family DNA-binding transcriptional regulator [Faunimonas pinastri]SEQ26155.1 transcriptional regulator, LacI family [Faunimonas pinastri]
MSEKKRATIKDVARETGLALSTVSNALSDKRYVSDETRALVSEAATRLGYRASTVARALRMQRSFTIGVLIADVNNPSSASFVRGVEDIATRESCTVLLCNTDGEEEKQLSHMRTLMDRQVDGMVLISQHCTSPEIRDLLQMGPPFVLVQRRSVDHKDDYVGADNVHGLAEAVRYVHSLGHRRVGFVRGPEDSSSARERYETYAAEAATLGLDRSEELLFSGGYSFEGGRTAGEHLLALSEPPTAIMASSDINALGVIEAALDRGMTVPRDLSVVGLDDISLARFKGINLTTIRLEKRDIGKAAAELLVKRIHAPTRTKRQIVLPTKLIIRGSAAAPKVRTAT